ncbi:MAG: hypothetical protein ACFFG0_50485 [Candidatus Thorarchaeota archaeon]
MTLPIDDELLDKIDLVKQNLGIDIKGYPQAIDKICDYVLRKEEEHQQELTQFKGIIERIFIFLQEKCKEEIYSDEEFFLDLVSFYEQLAEKVKDKGEKR